MSVPDSPVPPETEDGRRFTRRRLVVGGLVAGAVVVAADYGRYAAGDEFEEHVANVLGITPESARILNGNARARLGEKGYRSRAAAFVAATTFPGEILIPEEKRVWAIGALVNDMVISAADKYASLGLQPAGSSVCRGLLRT